MTDYKLEDPVKWVVDSNLSLIRSIPACKLNTYDFDGVIYLNENVEGVNPGHNDLVITGRSFEEAERVEGRLRARNLHNTVFFNPRPKLGRSRETSGEHKAAILRELLNNGFVIGAHFEDDEIQIEIIRRLVPEVPTVHFVHELTPKDFRKKSSIPHW